MDYVGSSISDEIIREMNAEIDADTIRRFHNGERLIRTESGPEWVHVVDSDGKQITDPAKLKELLGDLMY